MCVVGKGKMMALTLENMMFFSVMSVVFGAGGAYFTLKAVERKATTADGKADAIGKKLDELKNEFTEIKTTLDKDVSSLRREIEIFNENHVSRKDIEHFVTKKECQDKFKDVVHKTELDLILEKIELRFKHIENDMSEIKVDIKDILKILKERV